MTKMLRSTMRILAFFAISIISLVAFSDDALANEDDVYYIVNQSGVKVPDLVPSYDTRTVCRVNTEWHLSVGSIEKSETEDHFENCQEMYSAEYPPPGPTPWCWQNPSDKACPRIEFGKSAYVITCNQHTQEDVNCSYVSSSEFTSEIVEVVYLASNFKNEDIRIVYNGSNAFLFIDNLHEYGNCIANDLRTYIDRDKFIDLSIPSALEAQYFLCQDGIPVNYIFLDSLNRVNLVEFSFFHN